MGLIGDLKGPLAGFVLSAVSFVAIALYGLVDVLAVLGRPDPSLAAMVAAAAPYVVGLLVVGLAGLGFVAWGIYRVASGAVSGDNRLLQNEYVETAARYAERESDLARRFDLTEMVRPDPEERARRELADLKERYAEGELTEEEFERRVERLLSDSRVSETEVYRDVERERY
ncbi:hypothetical protein BRC81_00425 [Halobacteriales archaeon QS_1_68_20]|nr:MAG: hypothetical protein BRC81_00425 [Halobacteriales archaeon QS_1_68_20]